MKFIGPCDVYKVNICTLNYHTKYRSMYTHSRIQMKPIRGVGTGREEWVQEMGSQWNTGPCRLTGAVNGERGALHLGAT